MIFPRAPSELLLPLLSPDWLLLFRTLPPSPSPERSVKKSPEQGGSRCQLQKERAADKRGARGRVQAPGAGSGRASAAGGRGRVNSPAPGRLPWASGGRLGIRSSFLAAFGAFRTDLAQWGESGRDVFGAGALSSQDPPQHAQPQLPQGGAGSG